MCVRNYRGFDYNSGYPITELTLENIKHIFKPELMKQLKTLEPYFPNPGVSFNGNLGDFGLAKEAAEIVGFFGENEINVTINTNGSTRVPSWWAQLASPWVMIGFAIDGLRDTHSLYRIDTDWDKIIANARAFIDAGGRAIWRFIPFDHNRHQEAACRDMAGDLGFERFEIIYDGRDTGPVFSRSGEFLYQIGRDPGTRIPKIDELLDGHRTWFDPKVYKCPKDTPNLNLYCVHKKNREIYLAADGTIYPCCYLGFYPNQMQHPGNSQTRELVAENNALIYDLDHCMAWFDRVEATWNKPSIADGRLYHCVNNCNRP
jgi:hypothetical protein